MSFDHHEAKSHTRQASQDHIHVGFIGVEHLKASLYFGLRFTKNTSALYSASRFFQLLSVFLYCRLTLFLRVKPVGLLSYVTVRRLR